MQPFLCSLDDFSRSSKYWNQCSWDCIEKQSTDESDAMSSAYESETESTDESLYESMESSIYWLPLMNSSSCSNTFYCKSVWHASQQFIHHFNETIQRSPTYKRPC